MVVSQSVEKANVLVLTDMAFALVVYHIFLLCSCFEHVHGQSVVKVWFAFGLVLIQTFGMTSIMFNWFYAIVMLPLLFILFVYCNAC